MYRVIHDLIPLQLKTIDEIEIIRTIVVRATQQLITLYSCD